MHTQRRHIVIMFVYMVAIRLYFHIFISKQLHCKMTALNLQEFRQNQKGIGEVNKDQWKDIKFSKKYN